VFDDLIDLIGGKRCAKMACVANVPVIFQVIAS
jgi:hypothetical protein